MFSDKYLKVIDVAGNKIKEQGFRVIIKLGLLENSSLVSFDPRLNPGCTDKIKKQFALVTLKNIENLQARGVSIKKEWLDDQLYSFQIPPAILTSLSLKIPGIVSQTTQKQGPRRAMFNASAIQKTNE